MATLFAVIKYLKKKGMVDAAEKVQQLDDRLQEAESDPRLSNDPVVALKSVMKTHGIILDLGLGQDDSGDHFYAWLEIASDHRFCHFSVNTKNARTIKSDDIKQ